MSPRTAKQFVKIWWDLPIVEDREEDRTNWDKLCNALFRLEEEYAVKNQGSRLLVPADLAIKVFNSFREYLRNPDIELHIQTLPKPFFMVSASECKR